MSKITSVKADMIRLMRLKGVSFAAIGREVRLSRSTVQRYCYDEGVVPGAGDKRTFRSSALVTRGEEFTPEEDEKLLGLAGLGTMTWSEIGRALSRSPSSCEARVRGLLFSAEKASRMANSRIHLRETWRARKLRPKPPLDHETDPDA